MNGLGLPHNLENVIFGHFRAFLTQGGIFSKIKNQEKCLILDSLCKNQEKFMSQF